MADAVQQIVVVGASAGGVEACERLVRALPGDLQAPVLVVLHVPANAPSALPGILSRVGSLPAEHARDGAPLRNGAIYVARPDHHLLVAGDGTVRVTHGPRENGHRPAIDPLFRSAARYFGDRAVAVVLSGVLDDGSAGARVVKEAGGTVVVQDPEDALYAPMPAHAIAATEVDHVVPVADAGMLVGKIVAELAARRREGVPMDDGGIDDELTLTTMDQTDPSTGEQLAPASHYSCPDCHGVLNEIHDEGDEVRFRCRVGHAWSPVSLLAAQSDGLETALWTALRALEEKASLARRLAARARSGNAPHATRRFEEQAVDAQSGADTIRSLLANPGALRPSGSDAASA